MSVNKKQLVLGVVLTGGIVFLTTVIIKSLSRRKSSSRKEVDSSKVSSKRKKSGLYTKTGDAGTSSLYNGERRSKADVTFECLGHQDELNAIIGIAREHCAIAKNGLDGMLIEIESRIFDLGAAVATPVQTSSLKKKAYTEFSSTHTSVIEQWIDEVDGTLPPITNFVIPSGGMSSTYLNFARAVCRRAERSVYPLIEKEQVDAEVGRYLNRLSDLLFAFQRAAAMRENNEELIWRKAVLSPVVVEKVVQQSESVVSSEKVDPELLSVLVDLLPPHPSPSK
jgi:ATP:cob(I)alamin adenosyltransferase